MQTLKHFEQNDEFKKYFNVSMGNSIAGLKIAPF